MGLIGSTLVGRGRLVNQWPCAVVPDAGGGSDLLTDLTEWWEDANGTGKHNSNVWSGANKSTQTGGPNSLDYWEMSGSSASGLTGPSGWQTWASVARGSAAWQYVGIGAGQEIIRHHGTDEVYYVTGTSGTIDSGSAWSAWHSLVVVSNGTLMSTWVNGVQLHDEVSKTQSSTNIGYSHGSGTTDLALAVVAGRAWDQGDVNEFHNSGSFLTYADL